MKNLNWLSIEDERSCWMYNIFYFLDEWIAKGSLTNLSLFYFFSLHGWQPSGEQGKRLQSRRKQLDKCEGKWTAKLVPDDRRWEQNRKNSATPYSPIYNRTGSCISLVKTAINTTPAKTSRNRAAVHESRTSVTCNVCCCVFHVDRRPYTQKLRRIKMSANSCLHKV